jgi:hypothetical protein
MVSPTTVREPLPAHLEGPANAFRRRHRMHGPFLLYGGRIDPGKGCEELLEYFQAFLHDGGDAALMLMGVKLMPLPDDPRVRFAGLLPDQERLAALQAATVVVVPSPYESLSLLALEAFAVGTPVLANARSEVLVDHCRTSNAGLYYADRYEFAEGLKMLLKDPELRRTMGENGRAYVEANYRWDVIIGKYERMFARLRGGLGAAASTAPHGDAPRGESRRTGGRPDRGESRRQGHGDSRRQTNGSRREQGSRREADGRKDGESRRDDGRSGRGENRDRGDRRGGRRRRR